MSLKVNKICNVAETKCIDVESIAQGTTGFKNLIINGGFDIWQRGETDTSSGTGYKSADRWEFVNGSNSVTSSRDVYSGRGRLKINTVATTTASYMIQKIEGLGKFSGRTFTLSGGLASQVGGTYTYKIRANFGDGGSAALYISGGTINAGANYAYPYTINHSFAVPNLSSYTFGDNSFLQIEIYFGTDTLAIPNCATYLSNFQLERGSVATPFEQRPIGLELSLCQRYYYKFIDTTAGITMYPTMNAASTARRFEFFHPVEMRTIPTVLNYTVLVGTPSAVQQTTQKTRLNSTLQADGTQDIGVVHIQNFELDAEL